MALTHTYNSRHMGRNSMITGSAYALQELLGGNVSVFWCGPVPDLGGKIDVFSWVAPFDHSERRCTHLACSCHTGHESSGQMSWAEDPETAAAYEAATDALARNTAQCYGEWVLGWAVV
jgi:hypothetical protein